MQNGNTFGAQVRERRENAGVTLRSVADASGLSVAFLSDFELGRRAARKHTLAKLAKGLTANGIPTTMKQLVELHEKDRITKLEDELASLKKRRIA